MPFFMKAYPSLNDQSACNQIKFNSFLNAIPKEIKVDILKENISDYKKAIERAQTLQNILNVNFHESDNSKGTENPQSINMLQEEISNLKAKIESLTENNSSHRKVNNRARQNKNNFNNRHFNSHPSGSNYRQRPTQANDR